MTELSAMVPVHIGATFDSEEEQKEQFYVSHDEEDKNHFS